MIRCGSFVSSSTRNETRETSRCSDQGEGLARIVHPVATGSILQAGVGGRWTLRMHVLGLVHLVRKQPLGLLASRWLYDAGLTAYRQLNLAGHQGSAWDDFLVVLSGQS
jgi:hypothetical protein